MHFGNKREIRYNSATVGSGYGPDLHPSLIHPVPLSRLRKPAALSCHNKPFDPDELTRKLHIVLAEQQAYAERKKRNRAAAEAEREAQREARFVAARAKNAKDLDDALALDAARIETRRAEAAAAAAAAAITTKAASPARERRAGLPALKLQTGEPAAPSRKTNADEAPPSAVAYRHVPQVAASQFARTTTVESLTEKALASKLSRQSLHNNHHHYPQDPNLITPDTPHDRTSQERAKILRRTQSLRDRVGAGERNTLRPSRELATTAEDDDEAQSPKPLTRQNLHHLSGAKDAEGDEKGARRRSMGDVFQRIVAALEPHERSSPSPRSPLSPSVTKARHSHHETLPDPDEHRVDWTQSDEAVAAKPSLHHHSQSQSKSKPAEAQRPLRRAESKWALTSRLVSLSKNKGERQASSPLAEKDKDKEKEKEKEAAVASPKSPSRLGIFARFKR